MRIGRLLLAHTPPDRREEIIFEIVSQFNRSTALITSPDEREQLAQLNLTAGIRAKNAAAYSSALTHLAAGRALLAEDCWTRHYQLSFELEFHRAECEFLTNDQENAEARLAMLARPRAKSRRSGRRHLAAAGSLHHARPVGALCRGRPRLSPAAGIALSRHPTDEDVRQEYERLRQRLGTRPIEDLIDLPDDERRRLARDHERAVHADAVRQQCGQQPQLRCWSRAW